MFKRVKKELRRGVLFRSLTNKKTIYVVTRAHGNELWYVTHGKLTANGLKLATMRQTGTKARVTTANDRGVFTAMLHGTKIAYFCTLEET